MSPLLVIFNSDDMPFLVFLQSLQQLMEKKETTRQEYDKNKQDILPTHLYGRALRFYESLDESCHSEWNQLVAALQNRFPGAPDNGINSLSATPRSPTSAHGISTPAAVAPVTVTSLASRSGSSETNTGKLLPSKIAHSVTNLTQRLQSVSISRPLMPSAENLSPQVEVFSFFLEHGGTAWTKSSTPITRLVNIDYRDYKAVAAASKGPLLVISHHDAKTHRVGFTWAVNFGVWNMTLHHDVSGPKSVKFTRVLGDRGVVPERVARCEPDCLMGFLRDTRDKAWGRGPQTARPGKYTIKSYIRAQFPGERRGRFQLDYGVVKWKIELLKT
ncbi:hypothetical protein M407DRAFT_26882 [Tulasnella calospora MUT 4182]|uniref:Uncharacterized protein n=1 Tax=Tulasnella calospora MUT 4182 TaxID=1051891 RepID=A0A0C3QEX4_9AGAM|nr:hypothetical protein M407DRAFT_26882 [Tulasnella calospora MUT 4182]